MQSLRVCINKRCAYGYNVSPKAPSELVDKLDASVQESIRKEQKQCDPPAMALGARTLFLSHS